MPVISYFEAAHKYGLSDPTGMSGGTSAAILGTVTATNVTFTNAPAFASPYSSDKYVTLFSQTLSGGFTFNYVGNTSTATDAFLRAVVGTRTDTGEVLFYAGWQIPINIAHLGVASMPTVIDHDIAYVIGTKFNDIAMAPKGTSSTVDGGEGVDTVVLAGSRAEFFQSPYQLGITKGFTFTKESPISQVVQVINVERLQFTDQTLAFDTEGTAGKAFRLYQSALGRAPDAGGLGFQIRTLEGGESLRAVAQNFIGSPEFSAKYGALDNAAFVTQLYANVLHRAPDALGLAFHVNSLATGLGRADVLVGFSESPENHANLIGVMSGGMVFTG
jgi:hypothetical protein